jgi:hypothetical protein
LTPPIPTREPIQFVAGDTVQWTRVIADYPTSDGWTLHYKLIGPSSLGTDPAVTVANGIYNVTLAAASTAAASFTAGTYRMIGYVDGVSSERHTVFDGFVEILPNVAEVTYTNLKTHEERMLAQIQAALEGRTLADVEKYTIDGTQVDKIPVDRLMQLQGIYKAKIWRQQNPGQAFPVSVVRFVAPSNVSPDEALASPGWRR